MPTRKLKLGYGCFKKWEPALLLRWTRDLLVALHHPTIDSCPSFGCRLDNKDQFLHYLKQQPSVKAVIAGHTHLEAENIESNLAQYTTPSTFAAISHSDSADPTGAEDFWISHTMDSAVHGYRILDLSEDGSVDSFVDWLGT